MPTSKPRTYPPYLRTLFDEKSAILSKAQSYEIFGPKVGLRDLWLESARREEEIAPLLDILGRELEAAVHRISAASCYRKAKAWTQAANLFRAALSGPLLEHTRREVQEYLEECLQELRKLRNKGLGAKKARKLLPT